MSDTWVLDSVALLALLGSEPGGEDVARLLRQAQSGDARLLMTWVNVGEVAYIVEHRWGQTRLHQVLGTLEATTIEMVPVERALALAAARIKATHPLAYADAFAAALDRFFEACPDDVRYHVEVRTEAYLASPLFEVLGRRGVGQVLSHWTWLPSLDAQHRKSGRRFFNRGREAVVRLMTPRGVRYADAYKQAFPFDHIREGMESPGMIDDAVSIARKALQEDVRINMVVNNRAGGNAPLIARRFARRFLQRIAEEA